MVHGPRVRLGECWRGKDHGKPKGGGDRGNSVHGGLLFHWVNDRQAAPSSYKKVKQKRQKTA